MKDLDITTIRTFNAHTETTFFGPSSRDTVPLSDFVASCEGLKMSAELTCHISLSFSIFILVSITLERYQVWEKRN